MRKTRFLHTVTLLCVLVFFVAANYPGRTNTYVPLPSPKTDSLKSPFDKMMLVLMHERCVNCHPSDGIPKQGNDSHPHYFGITRGNANTGYEATNCATCHQSENNNYSGVPGAPGWSLAPATMRWEGLSRVEIANSMMDPSRNGGRTPEETLHHLTEHELVLWAWNPGVDANGEPREIPPVPKEEYIEAVKQWFADGHEIPTE